jgi:hypothetical protein
MKDKSFFNVNFLKSFLLYVLIFSLARFIFSADLDFLSTRNIVYILVTALILSVLNAVRKSQDFKSIDQHTVDELKERGFKFYIGFFSFLFLIVTLLCVVMLGLGAFIYYLFFDLTEWDWNFLWKTMLFALMLSILLSAYSFISDRWKIAAYYRSR